MPLIAIMSALEQEQLGLIELLKQAHQVSQAGRYFWLGDLHGQQVVLAISKMGKVAAATTATALIERFGAQRMVFTGVAGGLGNGVNVGDVVVGQAFLQHDLDVSPLFPRYEVPLYGQARFEGDMALTTALLDASRNALSNTHLLQAYPDAKVHLGLIVSGDRFVSQAKESDNLRSALQTAGHEALAVEMEGAAVAQVCHDYGVPFAAVRTISDRADDSAHVDFPSFLDQVASKYAQAIIERLLQSL
jgi:adenosylhomocysteine nucleosidase